MIICASNTPADYNWFFLAEMHMHVVFWTINLIKANAKVLEKPVEA